MRSPPCLESTAAGVREPPASPGRRGPPRLQTMPAPACRAPFWGSLGANGDFQLPLWLGGDAGQWWWGSWGGGGGMPTALPRVGAAATTAAASPLLAAGVSVSQPLPAKELSRPPPLLHSSLAPPGEVTQALLLPREPL